MREFQLNLNKHRLEKGLSFEDLHNLTGIPKTTLFRYETVENIKIPIDAVEKIENSLVLVPGTLMGWASDKNASLFDRIRLRREIIGMSQDELARVLGYKSRSTIAKIEAGVIDISQSKLTEFAEALNCSPAYLMGWEELPSPKVTPLAFFDVSVSAGTGQPIYEGFDFEIKEFENVPPRVEMAFRVRGDSMEPIYSDGDIVFVEPAPSMEYGEIGVFNLNNEGYLKKWEFNELVSINKKYPSIKITEDDYCKCIGKVVGKAEK